MLVALLLACTPASMVALELEADALTIAVPGCPWTIERYIMTSATDWILFNFAACDAQVAIHHEGSAGTVLVGNSDESGAVNTTTDNYWTLASFDGLVLPLTNAAGRGDAAHRIVPIASATASQPVSFLAVETPE